MGTMKPNDTKPSPQSLGGQATAKKLRQEALERYHEDPNTCTYCGSVIPVLDGQKVSEVRRKQFCNHSCAAKFNNAKYPKRTVVKTGYCQRCGKKIYFRRTSSGGYRRRKYCEVCRYLAPNNFKFDRTLLARTKGELFERCASQQSARSIIRKHACQVYAKSDMPHECMVCGYSKYVEICHIRPVADFPDDAVVSQLNALSNLVALCPNHHWELDHDLLDL